MAKRKTTKKQTAQSRTKAKKSEKKPPRKQPDVPSVPKPTFDLKAQRRLLRIINRARTVKDLMWLPPSEVAEHGHFGPGEPALHDEMHTPERVPLLDRKNAERLLSERDSVGPLYGFRRIDEIREILPRRVYDRLIDALIHRLSAMTYGQWLADTTTVTDGTVTIVPRHAALLRTGNVLLIEGACGPPESRTWLWNPYTRDMVWPAPVKDPAKALPNLNLYCAGHAFLSDGKLLAVGGGGESYQTPKNLGWILDPIANTWDVTRNKATDAQTVMLEHRWYPTVVTLGDHRMLIASGDLDNLSSSCAPPTSPAMQMEVFSDPTTPRGNGQYEYFAAAPTEKVFGPTYPGLHLIPPHEVFYVPVGFRNNSETPAACASNEDSSLLSFSGLSGTWDDRGPQDRTKGMSALIVRDAPPYIQAIVVGGGDDAKSRTYARIDLSAPTPAWGPDIDLPLAAGQPQATQRVHPNVVLLADGTVLVCGGAAETEPCWLFNPDTLTWTEMDELNYQRRYHSVALLLPTGEVMATGGQSTVGQSEVEVFQPPYLFNGPRPTISSVAPDPIHHGRSFTITTPDAGSITKVTLVRPMAVTHQTDSEQRVISLSFSHAGGNMLTATAPNPLHPHGLAPRGWYMLFLLNGNGVPSLAEFVYVH